MEGEKLQACESVGKAWKVNNYGTVVKSGEGRGLRERLEKNERDCAGHRWREQPRRIYLRLIGISQVRRSEKRHRYCNPLMEILCMPFVLDKMYVVYRARRIS